MTVSLSSDGSLLAFSDDPGVFKYLPSGQQITLTANFDVSDGHGGLTPSSALLKIDGVNDAPTVLVSPLVSEVTQNNSVQSFTAADLLLAIGASDVDGDTLKIVNLALLDPNGIRLTSAILRRG